MSINHPAYLDIDLSEIKKRATELRSMAFKCSMCPRNCEVNRTLNQRGKCGLGPFAMIASSGLHFGEEPHFVGYNGSGTIFFSGCNLGCIFCQNYDISHDVLGQMVDANELADLFLSVEHQGAHNLNLVTPSHIPSDIMEALAIAIEQGLSIPIVWNSSGYDSIEVLKQFDGIVDIYMPDFKFSTDDLARKFTKVNNYAATAKAAIKEMVRQVGPGLVLEDRIAKRGMSIRHLVMPELYDDSRKILDFLRQISPEITVNVMSQYYPAFLAPTVPIINKRVDFSEFDQVVQYAKNIGLKNVLDQA